MHDHSLQRFHMHEASQLKNISIGGICLITAQAFSPGTKLGIELKTPILSELTHLEGTVLESHERIKDIIYETRVEFTALPDQAKFNRSRRLQSVE